MIIQLIIISVFNILFSSRSVLLKKRVDIPQQLDLKSVLIIHRHGDRSQIGRSLGPSFPESDETAKFWHSKMPDDVQLQKMKLCAKVSESVVQDVQNTGSTSLEPKDGVNEGDRDDKLFLAYQKYPHLKLYSDSVYSGWDRYPHSSEL